MSLSGEWKRHPLPLLHPLPHWSGSCPGGPPPLRQVLGATHTPGQGWAERARQRHTQTCSLTLGPSPYDTSRLRYLRYPPLPPLVTPPSPAWLPRQIQIIKPEGPSLPIPTPSLPTPPRQDGHTPALPPLPSPQGVPSFLNLQRSPQEGSGIHWAPPAPAGIRCLCSDSAAGMPTDKKIPECKIPDGYARKESKQACTHQAHAHTRTR